MNSTRTKDSIRISVLIIAGITLSGCSLVGIRTEEEAPYSTIKEDSSFEIRQYSNYVSAETVVADTDWDSASSAAFRRLAGYIFGKNVSKEKISMTAPVFMSPDEGDITEERSEKIAMTAPVLAAKDGEGWKMSFVLPSSIDIDNAPTPLNSEVVLKEKVGKKYAVVRFSGVLSEEKFERYSNELKQWATENNLKTVADPVLAGYDPPWTIPFLRRNEVLVEIE